MTIQVGATIPEVTVMTMGPDGPTPVAMQKYLAGKKTIIFIVPGAFTPTCSARHLPGFMDKADALFAKGVDQIACLSVNDAFVMAAWGRDQKIDDKIAMLADGSAHFVSATGLAIDMGPRGLGMRGKRAMLIIDDGVVRHVAVEENPGALEVSSAEAALAQL